MTASAEPIVSLLENTATTASRVRLSVSGRRRSSGSDSGSRITHSASTAVSAIGAAITQRHEPRASTVWPSSGAIAGTTMNTAATADSTRPSRSPS